MDRIVPALVALSLASWFAEAGGRDRHALEHRRALEVFRCPSERLSLEGVVRAEASRIPWMSAGDGAGVYLIVLRLAAGERFVSGRLEIEDGLFRIAGRRRRPARVLRRVGYELLVHELSPELRGSVVLLSSLLLPEDSPVRWRSRLTIRPRDVQHHADYAAFLAPAATGPLARVSLTGVVIGPPGDGRRRRRRVWTANALLPRASDPAMTEEAFLQTLFGARAATAPPAQARPADVPPPEPP